MLIYMGSGAALAAYHRSRRIQALVACARACNQTARYCLDRVASGGPDREHAALVHALAVDCQEFCTLTAALLARGSERAADAFPACAEACRECAEACEPGEGDEILRECARRCRTREQICRTLAGSVADRDRLASPPRRI